ncbi:MAG: DUF2783 domain-containing protein [Rhodobacteraceae bacterium]|nr:DUF2783 domain-containing protein [Paracoccaceae bacterium]
MPQLNTAPNLPDADQFYEKLIAAHAELSDQDSQAMNARLILILCNHIGDPEVLDEALACARETGR